MYRKSKTSQFLLHPMFKTGKSSLLRIIIAKNLYRFMVGFICIHIFNLMHLRRTSVALLKLESTLDLQNHLGKKSQNMLPLSSALPIRNLSNANAAPNLFISKMSKQFKPINFLLNAVLGSSLDRWVKYSRASPDHRIGLPPAHGSPVAGSDKQIHRKWQKKKWRFELSIANTIVLEQVAPEDAISYGRHYTESVRNRSRPLRPGTAAVSDASFLAALSPADFASIKRIWIWGGPPTSLPVA